MSAIIEKHYRCVKKHSVRVEELGKPFSVGNLSKDDLSEIGVPCIIYGELFTTYGAIISKVESHTKKIDGMTLSRKGDLLFPSSTNATAERHTKLRNRFPAPVLPSDRFYFVILQ